MVPEVLGVSAGFTVEIEVTTEATTPENPDPPDVPEYPLIPE